MAHYTVWDCVSPTSGEYARLVRPAYPDDHEYQHDFQRVVSKGLHENKEAALQAAANIPRKV